VLGSQLVLPDRAVAAGFTYAHEMLEAAMLDVLAHGEHRASATKSFEDSTDLELPLESAFEFFSDATNLARITPPDVRLHILTPGPIAMRRGAVIEYVLRVRGLPVRWKSLIVQWQPGVRFVDYQLRGPYQLWRHEHRFTASGVGTLVTDRVDYSLPFAPLSDVALPLVSADLARIFAYRRAAMEKETGR